MSRWLLVLIAGCRFGFDERAVGTDGNPDTSGDSSIDGDASLSVKAIASWSFDDVGQDVADSIGSYPGVLGTTTGAESSDPMRVMVGAEICSGTGLRFDGGNDVVTIQSASASDLAKFSISFSLYPTGPGGNSLPRILTKEDGVASDVIVHYRASENAIAINMFDSSNNLFATFGEGVVLDERANWVVSYDDTGDRLVHVFKNGVETSYLRQDPMVGTLRTTTNVWRIGNQATGSRGFDGTIDALRIFDAVLSSDEVVALSQLCAP